MKRTMKKKDSSKNDWRKPSLIRSTMTITLITLTMIINQISTIDRSEPNNHHPIIGERRSIGSHNQSSSNGFSFNPHDKDLRVTKTFVPDRCKIKSRIGDELSILFMGTFPDSGKKFDSVIDIMRPFIVKPGEHRLMRGLELGCIGMCIGESRLLKIPPELGFGKTGNFNGAIPPNSWLDINVQLLSILNRKSESISNEEDRLEIKSIYFPEINRCSVRSKVNDTLSMLYRGTLSSNGKQFDEISDKNNPFKFRLGLGEVIKGWDLGLRDMCIGEKRLLKIPADLGYGKRGYEPSIPPDSTLIFETELLEIMKDGSNKTYKVDDFNKSSDEKVQSEGSKSFSLDKIFLNFFFLSFL